MYDPKKPLIGRVSPLSNVIVADARPYILALFGAVTFVCSSPV
jgi:hypothetical protein